MLLATLVIACCCWLSLIGQCAGQKPINLGGSKKRDVYIAGFFPYGNHVPEGHIGRGVMPAVKLAVEHINEHPTILRDYRLHMWWNDTEVSEEKARESAQLRFFRSSFDLCDEINSLLSTLEFTQWGRYRRDVVAVIPGIAKPQLAFRFRSSSADGCCGSSSLNFSSWPVER
jgi:gamma-aminobutyric acid type B receptor